MERAGAHRRPVYFVILIGAMLVASSCYSWNYRREMAASVALISDLSNKLMDYCRSDFVVDGRSVSSEEMGEFYYGLKKARAFQQMSAKRHGSDAASMAFDKMIDAFEKFVRDADQYRLSQKHTPLELDKLIEDRAYVRARLDDLNRAQRRET